MMRQARHFNDYNFRKYAMRRVRGGFEKNRHLEGYVPYLIWSELWGIRSFY